VEMDTFVLTGCFRIIPFAFPSFGRVRSTLQYGSTRKASRDFNVMENSNEQVQVLSNSNLTVTRSTCGF
jgi:hypothetical protein